MSSIEAAAAADTGAPWSRADFEGRLRERGQAYHIHHPFNRMLNEGRATPEQVRGWVANRYYYQIAIPVKDAAILSNCPDRAVRRRWIQRILDHDGFSVGEEQDEGGIEAWLHLADAVGLAREEVEDLRHVVPAVRFAVDAYVNFARRAPWQEAVCSSLTELFAPEIHRQRLSTWPGHYPWIADEGLRYFRERVSRARRDVEQGLEVTLSYFATRAQQERALEILQFKLDILWAMNDAMAQAYGVQMTGMAATPAIVPRVGSGFRLQWEPAQSAWVLLYPEGMVKLNQSAGEILRRCDGERRASDIVADLENAFSAVGLEPDVLAFLDVAQAQRWLAWDEPA